MMNNVQFRVLTGCFILAVSSMMVMAEPNKLEAITGGFVVKPIPEGAKIVKIIDSRTSNTNNVLAKFESRLWMTYRLPFEVVKADYTKYDNAKGDVVIAIVDKGDFLVYPDKHLAIVPCAESMDKSLSRALAFALNASTDRDNASMIAVGAKNLGIPPALRTSYKLACEQGWAPAPTNDYQKAIWEKVKAAKEAAAKPAEATEAK